MQDHPVLELHRKLKVMRLLGIGAEEYEQTSASYCDWALEIDRVDREVAAEFQAKAIEAAKREARHGR